MCLRPEAEHVTERLEDDIGAAAVRQVLKESLTFPKALQRNRTEPGKRSRAERRVTEQLNKHVFREVCARPGARGFTARSAAQGQLLPPEGVARINSFYCFTVFFTALGRASGGRAAL